MITIIGITDAGPLSLLPGVLDRVRSAEVLCGGERHLALFPEVKAERWVIKSSPSASSELTLSLPKGQRLADLVQYLRKEAPGKRVVILASGDPNFYGIGGYLSQHLPKEWIEIFPNVTAVQLAFARIKESWQDAAIVSVHGRPVPPIIEIVRKSAKVAIFTDDKNTPGVVAKALLAAGISKRRAVVCEHLDGVQERIVDTTLEALPDQSFAPLNLLIFLDNTQSSVVSSQLPVAINHGPFDSAQDRQRTTDPSTSSGHRNGQRTSLALGIPDSEFACKRGLITRQEIRVISLAKLQLKRDSVVWDIGAGSGSLSIEAAQIAREGQIFAVEKDEECVQYILDNCTKFGTTQINVTKGWAPEACLNWSEPDAVFVGGSGGKMKEILDMVFARLRPNGHLVLNLIVLERLYEVTDRLRAQGWTPEVTQVSISRSKEILDMTRLVPLDPVFIVSAQKK